MAFIPRFTKEPRNFPVRRAAILALAALVITGCTKRKVQPVLSTAPAVIWTDISEIASCVELFNKSQDKYKAVVQYRENPAESLDFFGTVKSADTELPDIVIGTALKNTNSRAHFLPLDFLFSERSLDSSRFYPSLLEAGKLDGKQYFLPLSFNMPAVAFDSRNEDLIGEPYMISVEQIRDIAASFNAEKNGQPTVMGFAPSWDGNFLYLVTQLWGAEYRQDGEVFSWNEDAISSAVNYLRNWTENCNGSTQAEKDFSFKYLYTPKYKQISSGRCLFAYTTSRNMLSVNEEILQNLDFRWIHKDKKIPIADTLVSIAIDKHSLNSEAAEAFIVWLMQEETQKNLLQRTKDMNLNTAVFGIAGGFSALRDVTEKVFPMYYETLLGSLPVSEYLDSATILPPKWDKIKEKVIIPYLEKVTDTSKISNETLSSALEDWNKQNY